MRTPEEILRQSHTIAVVGLSDDRTRDAYGVAKYLQEQGYRIVPVHPTSGDVLGEKTYRALRDIPFPVDLVDVFRRAETVVPIAEDTVAIGEGVLAAARHRERAGGGCIRRRVGRGHE